MNNIQTLSDNISLMEDVEDLLNITPNVLRDLSQIYNQKFTSEPTGQVVYIPFSDWKKINPDWAKNLIYTCGTDEKLKELAKQLNIPHSVMVTYQIITTVIELFLQQYGNDLKIIKVTNKTIHCQEVS